MGNFHISGQPEVDDLWNRCLSDFEDRVDKSTYEMVLKNASPVFLDPKTLELSLQKAWQKEKLIKYIDGLSDYLSEEAGNKINLVISVGKNGKNENHIKQHDTPRITERKKTATKRKVSEESVENDLKLDPKYLFDTFIVGNNNRIAAAAAHAVAEAPARAYNPLFIYGGVGLGKTHLLHAIGHRVLQKKPNATVVYVSAEKFMNDLVESIQDKKMKQFRRKYRFSDVFLIDDIQFIKNKETMQEEFFHTFNELHAAKSQIVITSDRSPKDIPTLQDRLRSRFEWGLTADIQPPELETRMAILKNKAETEKVDVSNEIISYIAEKIPSNIRELEGALNRIIAFASLMGQPIDIELCVSALREILPDTRPRHLTTTLIQEKTCEYYGIGLEDLLGSRRDSKLVLPRHVAMYLCREMVGASFPSIGKSFGGRDHTTIMNGCKNIQKKKRNSSVKNDIENIKNMLKSEGG